MVRAVSKILSFVLLVGVLAGPAVADDKRYALLLAPFSASEAKAAQEGWARSLGVKRERINSVGQTLVLIPPGEFEMGNEETVDELMKAFPYVKREFFEDAVKHKVRISQPFVLTQHEVTIGQFRRFVTESGYKTEAEKDGKGGRGFEKDKYMQDPRFSWKQTGFEPSPTEDHPVVNVTWNDAIAFCNWLSRQERKSEYYRVDGNDVSVLGGNGYRLPTEAEWEYACRAGTTTRYHSGNDPESLAKVGNIADGTVKAKFSIANAIAAKDGYVYTAPVGRFAPNSFGLHDMHGNVNEWCGDWYGEESYATALRDDPRGPSLGSMRVGRGGCYVLSAAYCRSATRYRSSPDFRSTIFGFRVAGAPSSE